MPSYRKYYGRPEWRAKVGKILRRDSHTCQHCGARDNLQCHHLKYFPGRMPWEYPDYLLITLCDDCHIVQTKKQRRTRSCRRMIRYALKRWRRRRR